MNQLQIADIQELTMSSREIAELCEKEHRNVKRDVEKMFTDLQIDALKYEHTYFDQLNRKQVEYALPKDLTLTLIAGYRTDIRYKIVSRWLELETRAVSPTEMLLEQCKRMVAQERKLKLVEDRQDDFEKKLAEFDGETGYQTVTAFCRTHHDPLPLSEANALGRKATALCKSRNIKIGSIPDERFGRVNSYPIEILKEVAR